MLTDIQKQKVSAFLFYSGHANPRFVGKHVVYRDQTRGYFAMDKLIEYEAILEVVDTLSLLQIDDLVQKAGLNQVAIASDLQDLDKWTNNPAIILQQAKEPSRHDFIITRSVF